MLIGKNDSLSFLECGINTVLNARLFEPVPLPSALNELFAYNVMPVFILKTYKRFKLFGMILYLMTKIFAKRIDGDDDKIAGLYVVLKLFNLLDALGWGT